MITAQNIGYYEDERDQLVEKKTAEFMRVGKEYDPFSVKHIAEALMELPNKEIESLQFYCDDIRYPSTKRDEHLLAIGRLIYTEIYNYWENLAIEQAEKETLSAEEMQIDAKYGDDE